VTDAVSRYRGVRAAAVLAFGGVALLAGACVIALVVVERWRHDNAVVAVTFWALVVIGVALAIGLVRAAIQIGRQPTALRLDATGYRIGRQSGATGARRADWHDVERVRTEQRDGGEVVEIQLHSGGSTRIPVSAIGVPRDEWLTDLDDRLNRAHGQRRLT
jgi:hypothetical protein